MEREDARRQLALLRVEELFTRGKVSLDMTWLKKETVEESARLPAPALIAVEIAEDRAPPGA